MLAGQLQAPPGRVETVGAAVDGHHRVVERTHLVGGHIGRVGHDDGELLARADGLVQIALADLDPITETSPVGIDPGPSAGAGIAIHLDQAASRQEGGDESDLTHARTQLQDGARRDIADRGHPRALFECPRARGETRLIKRERHRPEDNLPRFRRRRVRGEMAPPLFAGRHRVTGHRRTLPSATTRTSIAQGDGAARPRSGKPLDLMPTTTPFAPGSISMRLYPHNELGAAEVIREICLQAGLALANGFDGVMTSEHHGGFAGYLCNPLQMTSFILEDHGQGWAAPSPMVLPLRPTAQVAEEVAWLNARHPGRVGLGVCAGALPLDFEAMDVPLSEAVPRFKAALPEIVDMLRGRNLRGLDGDQALQLGATAPIPVLSAAASTTAARRAAGCGAGILMEGMSTVERLTSFCAAYDEAGGTQSKVLIRRVWLGEPLTELVEKQRQVYQSYSSSPFAADQTLTTTDPAAMADALHQTMVEVGADAINLRIHLPGINADDARCQIMALAEDVVPRLRQRLRSPAR